MEIKKEKGNIAAFIIIILSFISFITFSTSFLIFGEIQILKDKKLFYDNKNYKNIIDIIAETYFEYIDSEINKNENIKDIVDYISKDGNDFIFLKNYNQNKPTTDSNFILTEITINRFNENKKIIEIPNFNFQKIIQKNSTSNDFNYCSLKLRKEVKNLIVKGTKHKFDLVITGTLNIVYKFSDEFNKNSLQSCEVKEINFEINEIKK